MIYNMGQGGSDDWKEFTGTKYDGSDNVLIYDTGLDISKDYFVDIYTSNEVYEYFRYPPTKVELYNNGRLRVTFGTETYYMNFNVKVRVKECRSI